MSDVNSSEPAFFAGHWSEKDFAEQRGVSPRTLRAERQRGESPPYVKDGRKVYYPIATARDWVLRKVRIPVRSEPQAPKAGRIAPRKHAADAVA